MQKSMRIRIDGFRKGAASLALFLLLASIQMAFGHGGMEHVMGTVSKVSAQSVTVETTAKKMIEVSLNSKTKYTRNDKNAGASDLKVGDRVMIEAKEVNEKLVAETVKLGSVTSNSEHGDHSKK